MLILKILSLEPAHGYGIAQRCSRSRARPCSSIRARSIRRCIASNRKRWLKSEWRPSETGREAKFYALTRAGQKQLAVEKETWDRLTDAVQLIFNEGE